jgi:RNA polymerase sigma factor (sigma-70 family)
MADRAWDTTYLLNQLRMGNPEARQKLIEYACERLRRLTRQMLRGFPAVARWVQSDDVLQPALLRLHRALAEVVPESSAHFWNLAALQIRRELVNLARRFQGPEGLGAKHHTDGKGKAADDEGGPLATFPDSNEEPSSLERWTRIHQLIEALPKEEREIVHLLLYDGLTQPQAAEVLGVSIRTVRRRWRNARLLLRDDDDENGATLGCPR